MNAVFKTMLAALLRDMHTIVLTVILPIGLLLGLGLYHENPDYSQRLLGGVLAMQVLVGSSMVTAFYVMAQRNKGIYKLLRITPFSTASFICAMTASRAVLSMIVNLIILAAGIFILKVELSFAAILAVLLILLAGTVCFTAVGFIAANLSKDESNVNLISNLFSFPMLFMSEAFYSLQGAPAWLLTLSKLNPFAYFVDSLGIAISQLGSSPSFWQPLAILTAFAVLLMAVAAVTFRWDSERFSRRRAVSGKAAS